MSKNFMLVVALLIAPLAANSQTLQGTNSEVDVAIFPYKGGPNHCPSGLQPVVVGGVICCGSPNQSTPFFTHSSGGAKKKYRVVCPVDEKGCRRVEVGS